MRWMRATMWGCLVIATLGLASTFVVESGYAGRMTLVQPIRKDPKSDTGWRLAGPEMELLGIPEAAYVTRGAPGIPAQVDAEVLAKSKNVVPMVALRATVHAARLGALAAILLMTIGLALVGRIPVKIEQ